MKCNPYYLCTTEYFPPNHSQMATAIKGRDVLHEARRKRMPWWLRTMLNAIAFLFLLVAFFGAMFLIASVVTR